MLKLKENHVRDLLSHLLGITRVISEAGGVPDEPENPDPKPTTGSDFEELEEMLRSADPCPPCANTPSGADAAQPPYCPDCYRERERMRRDRIMNRLCGRWASGSGRLGVEIVRRGDHLVLGYLKRGGGRSDERYVLLSYDGESFIFYGHDDRVTSVSHDTETDTMISPGADYTRVVEIGK